MGSGGRKDERPRSERRRDTGEDFTPEALVSEMLDKVPATSWADPEHIFLDPSCGNGNFLIAVKNRLLSLGLSEKEALRRVRGIDIMHDNVVEACIRLGLDYDEEASFAVSKTVICANTLECENIPALFEKAEREFLYTQLKAVLLELKPAVKHAPDKEKAVEAWKRGRDLALSLK